MRVSVTISQCLACPLQMQGATSPILAAHIKTVFKDDPQDTWVFCAHAFQSIHHGQTSFGVIESELQKNIPYCRWLGLG